MWPLLIFLFVSVYMIPPFTTVVDKNCPYNKENTESIKEVLLHGFMGVVGSIKGQIVRASPCKPPTQVELALLSLVLSKAFFITLFLPNLILHPRNEPKSQAAQKYLHHSYNDEHFNIFHFYKFENSMSIIIKGYEVITE